MAITLYVKGACPHCRALREGLEASGRPYRLVDLEERKQAVAELRKLTGGRRIVPVLVDGTSISVAPDGGTEF
ncbi:MAG: glutaredoxin [Hyphomicrobiaceae bacterium]|jgi:glutaredoxin